MRVSKIGSEVRERHVAIALSGNVNSVSPIAQRYIEQNYQSLTSIIGVGSTSEIPLSGNRNWFGIGDVETSSALPSGWVPRLVAGQVLKFYVHHQPAVGLKPEHLSGLLVTSGGNPLTDKQAGLAAITLNGMGGSILRRAYGNNAANTLIGLSGSWSQNNADWPGATMSYGHIGVLING